MPATNDMIHAHTGRLCLLLIISICAIGPGHVRYESIFMWTIDWPRLMGGSEWQWHMGIPNGRWVLTMILWSTKLCY